MQLSTRVRLMAQRRGRSLSAPLRRLHRCRDGLAILELALIMPLIVFLILVFADVGLLFYGYVNSANALREGARCGAVGYSDAAVVQRVEDLSGFVDPISVVVSDRVNALIGDAFAVTGTFEHTWITPVVGGLTSTQYTRTATTRLETDRFDKVDCIP